MSTGQQNLPDQQRWEILLEMFKATQKNIARLDDISMKLKGWAITVWAGLIGFGLSERLISCMTIAGVVILLFWAIDVQYKFFHEQFLRINANIEELLIKGRVTASEVPLILTNKQMVGSIFDASGKIHPDFIAIFRRPWFHALYMGLLAATLFSCLGLL